ncbi:hypothetical protein DFH07DRAFT_777969 [Mycena maculata]|uniref:Uncharacterized protein n=1 Tax=Mycena maculata TaxID=230809 RepID=A0AAD7N1J7_9AGAR|nr:hypothetical protein DFH07DRAFT_777969 [Mycena maculata]
MALARTETMGQQLGTSGAQMARGEPIMTLGYDEDGLAKVWMRIKRVAVYLRKSKEEVPTQRKSSNARWWPEKGVYGEREHRGRIVCIRKGRGRTFKGQVVASRLGDHDGECWYQTAEEHRFLFPGSSTIPSWWPKLVQNDYQNSGQRRDAWGREKQSTRCFVDTFSRKRGSRQEEGQQSLDAVCGIAFEVGLDTIAEEEC